MAAGGAVDGDGVGFTDHYLVLRLPSGEEGARLTADEIDKAYKTQSRLRHPDKRPDDPNATADFQALRASYDALRDEPTRRALDARLRAKRDRAAFDATLNARRKDLRDDLRRREKAAEVDESERKASAADRQERLVAEKIKREIEELQSRAAAKRSRSADAGFASSSMDGKDVAHEKGKREKMLKVSWDGSLDHYTAAKLKEIFSQFGDVEDIVINAKKSKKRGSAIVAMSSKEAALAAIQNPSLYDVLTVPLSVLPIQPSTGSTTRPVDDAQNAKFGDISGVGFRDFEASILKKLQEKDRERKVGANAT